MSKVTKTEPPKAGPLTLLATLDRDELEAALATAEQELEALVVERRRSIDAIRLFLKAARIRDGIEVRKKPVKKLKMKAQSVMAGNSDDGSDSAKGVGYATTDMRSVALKVRAAIVHGGPQTIEALVAATGLSRALLEVYLGRTEVIQRGANGKYALAS
jgi:multidrug resistance efflux pump